MIPTDASVAARYRAARGLPTLISGKIRRAEQRQREEAVARGEVTCVEWTDAAPRGEIICKEWTDAAPRGEDGAAHRG